MRISNVHKVALVAFILGILGIATHIATQPWIRWKLYTELGIALGTPLIYENPYFQQKSRASLLNDWWNSSRQNLEKIQIRTDWKSQYILSSERMAAKQLNVAYGIQERSWQPGVLIHQNKKHPVKLKLKGHGDHYVNHKWSLSVKMKKGQLFELREFALQGPHTRGYYLEPLFMDYARQQNLISPKYRFVRLSINDQNMGIMALEEKPTPRTPYLQNRNLGLVFRSSWKARRQSKKFGHYLVDWRLAPFDAVETRGESFDAHLAFVQSALKAMAENRLGPGDIFDVERVGKFFAVIDLWGAVHSLSMADLRFYLDPKTMKIELIPYDVTLGSIDKEGVQSLVTFLLEDPQINAAYQKYRRKFRQPEMLQSHFANAKERSEHYRRQLLSEFLLLPPLNLATLAKPPTRIEDLRPTRTISSVIASLPETNLPAVIRTTLVPNKNGKTIQLTNLLPHSIRVVEVQIQYKDGHQRTKKLKKMIDATLIDQPPSRLDIPVGRNVTQVTGYAMYKNERYRFVATPTPPDLAFPPAAYLCPSHKNYQVDVSPAKTMVKNAFEASMASLKTYCQN